MLDVVGYRLHGHNELDEPAFTQPQMYHRIREMQPVLELYKQSLLNESTVDPSYIEVSSETLSEEPSPTDTTCCTTPERRARPTAS